IAPEDAAAQRTQATLRWLLPILRLSLACLWIVTGVLSLGIYPVASSYELLARAGVPAGLQPLALYGAALLDIVLGLLVLLPRRTRRLWAAQAALVLGYTAIISWRLPEFWLHPYGPVLKNVPLLAMLWLLYELERPWNTRWRSGCMCCHRPCCSAPASAAPIISWPPRAAAARARRPASPAMWWWRTGCSRPLPPSPSR